MPTCSELLNPCSCPPSAVPRLRPWLEEYCLQLEQLPGCVSMANAVTGERGCHPCGGYWRSWEGVWGRGKKAEMSSGPPENGAFVWGTDEGQGGDCVGGGRKYHTDWHHHSQHRIHPSPALRLLCPKGPAPDLVRESSVCPKAARVKRWREGCAARRKTAVSPTFIPENRRQKKKTESSFYYIYIRQNFTRNNPYCTVRRALGV